MSAIPAYINQVLPDVGSLESLDDIVSGLEDQQAELSARLDELQARIGNERDVLLKESYAILDNAASFRAAHGKLKDRLINASYRPQPKFLGELQLLTTRLDNIELAKAYFNVLLEVHRICDDAKSKVLQDPQAAIHSLDELQVLRQHITDRNNQAENSAVHLIRFLNGAQSNLQTELTEMLSVEFREALEAVGWPRHVSGNLDAVTVQIHKLLLFQASQPTLVPPSPLIAFKVMAEPLDVRFRFHFEGARETNRADRPEWMFTHFISTIEECKPFMESTVQKVLDDHVSGRLAINELIYAYLASIQRKLKTMIPLVQTDPQLFSHLMLETMKFDDCLRDEYGFAPYGQDEWEGVTGYIMAKNSWFESWIAVEKDFAFDRYQDIINAADAWVIDFDSVGERETKPTKSALRLRDLLDTIIERYRPLKSFLHRVRFLMDIQIAILDSYHNRIAASLDAFESLSSSIARAVAGVHEEERKKMVYGLAGAERLCRAYGSASTMRDALRDWGDDLFFLELYDELNTRASNGRGLDQIPTKLPSLNDDDGTIFDEIISAYDALRDRAEKLIIKHLQREVQKSYKTDSVFRQSVKSKDVFARDLVNSSAVLSEIMTFLSKALSQTSFDYISLELYRSLKF